MLAQIKKMLGLNDSIEWISNTELNYLIYGSKFEPKQQLQVYTK